MATTVNASFEQFRKNLEITDRQENLVTTSRANLEQQLRRVLNLNGSTQVIGSWDRNTLIRPLNEADVDVMVILNYSTHKDWDTPYGTAQVLARFREILNSAYNASTIKTDSNCVTVQLSAFRMDVIPAFKHEGGYYIIPDSNKQTWISTDPFSFAELITKVNKQMEGSFVPFIKMVKGWNQALNWPLKSFHLECMLYYYCRNFNQAYSYSSLLSDFFTKLPSYLQSRISDPVKGEIVSDYLDWANCAYLVQKAQSASNTANYANVYEQSNPAYAINQWNSIMGRFFPAYG